MCRTASTIQEKKKRVEHSNNRENILQGPDTCQDVEDMPYCVAGGGVRRSLVGL